MKILKGFSQELLRLYQPKIPEKEKLSTLLWFFILVSLISLPIMMVATVLVAMAWPLFKWPAVFWIIFLTYLSTFFQWIFYRKRKYLKLVIYTETALDIIFITAVIHFMPHHLRYIGFFVYFLVLAPTAILGSLPLGTWSLSWAFFGYLTLISLENWQVIIPPTIPQATFSSQIASGLATFVVYYIVIFLFGYFTDLIKRKNEQVAELASKLMKLYLKTKVSADIIIRKMAEGLLVLDEKGKIIRANEMASILLNNLELVGQSLLAISEKTHSNLGEIIKELGQEKAFVKIIKLKEPIERILEVKGSHLRIKDKKRGMILLLRDITPSWGIVYDSETKEPVESAIVRIFDKEYNKLLETKVTDGQGRFEFLVKPGEYFITATKEGYLFPSKSHLGYHGEPIQITEPTKAVINVKIPLDHQ